jgi:predicted oxidoreductase (fatty acid repression mutant protein)
MALENGGLDAQVEQRMDAYRSNPQQLQQRYGQNKELLDLLALQKLTSEKQAAARDMQMKMQQQPGTIAQQREQEALELTKQEMGGTLGELAGRTKGTLDQKQVMQQQNMQKMAQGQPPVAQGGIGALMGGQQARPPMQGVPPQAQGLANARMQAPVQMAKGGIVSFADGKEVTSSYYGRALANLRDKFKAGSAADALRQKVEAKYGTFSSILGGFRSQSDEQRQYAKDVIASLNKFSVSELQQLADAEFTPGMTDLSALPVLPTTPAAAPNLTPTVTSASAAPPAASVASAADNTTGSVTLEQPDPYQTAMARLPEEVFNIPAVSPIAPSETEVDAAQKALLGVVGDMPNEYTPKKVPFAELAPVSPESSLDPQGIEARRFLLQRGADLAGADVNSSVDAARVSADEYSLRGAKQETARQQLAREQAYQARVLDPKRVKKLKRMETLGGGAKYGTGGIGQAFVESERRYDELEAKGLANLVALEQAAMTNDYNLVAQGMGAGENAATRAQADRVSGINIANNEVTNQQNLAVGQQALQQGINTANTAAQNTALAGQYGAELAAINNEAKIRSEVLSAETTELQSDTARAVQLSANEQQALVKNAEAKIAQAKEQDTFQLELQRLRRLDEDAAQTLFYTQLNKLREEKNAILDSDVNYQDLLTELSQAESEADYAAANKKVTNYEDTMEAILANRFALDYARVDELRTRIEQLRSQNIATNNPPRVINPEDEDVTVTPINP